MRLRYKFFWFCVVGGTGALIELFVFNVMFFLGLVFAVSKFIGLFLSLCFNFITNRNFTFSARSEKMRVQAMRYAVVYAIAFLVNFFSSLLFVSFLNHSTLEANIASALGVVCAIPVTFLGSLLWIFRNGK